MAITDKFKWSQALISGVALENSTDGLPTAQKGTSGAGHVVPPSEMPAAATVALIRNLTTTRQTIQLPSGAVWVAASYRLLPGATAVTSQFARLVVNASSDADAAGKLALDGAFLTLCQGDDLLMSANDADPITRIDVIASQAVAAEVTLLTVVAGVRS